MVLLQKYVQKQLQNTFSHTVLYITFTVERLAAVAMRNRDNTTGINSVWATSGTSLNFELYAINSKRILKKPEPKKIRTN